MEHAIVPIGVIGIIFFGLVSIIRTITDYQLRRKLIQLGHVDKQATDVLRQTTDNRLASLKWGLIILFGGIGLIIISLVGMDDDSPLPFGIEAVCIAMGFLAYYFVSRNAGKSSGHHTRLSSEKPSVDYINS